MSRVCVVVSGSEGRNRIGWDVLCPTITKHECVYVGWWPSLWWGVGGCAEAPPSPFWPSASHLRFPYGFRSSRLPAAQDSDPPCSLFPPASTALGFILVPVTRGGPAGGREVLRPTGMRGGVRGGCWLLPSFSLGDSEGRTFLICCSVWAPWGDLSGDATG